MVMTDFIIAVIFLVLAVVVVALRKAFFALPVYELKRQAAAGDQYSKQIYPVVAYGETFRALLWLLLGIFVAVSLVLFDRLAPVWFGVILDGILLWLTFSWFPHARARKFNRQLALYAVPVFAWVLHYTYPIVKELGKLGRYYDQGHTGIYENEDLHQVLVRQELQTDNRISAVQLGRLRKFLAFETAVVSQYQTDWKNIMKLSADAPISPLLLDEMHQSGQTAFPVTKTKNSKSLVGILNRDDVGLKSDGRIADHMHSNVRYIKQDEPMESALAKFALSGQVMFVVINKAEDIVGALTLKDALGSLLAPDNRNIMAGEDEVSSPGPNSDNLLTDLELETGDSNESTE